MKIAVIGAGVVGIASAYELVLDGHEVVVFDSNSAAAESASFANTGVIAPSLMQPLSHPSWPTKSWLNRIGERSLLQLRRAPSLAEINFMWRWGHHQNPTDIDRNVPLCLYALRFPSSHPPTSIFSII